jgi:hypothetical protein
MIRNVCLPVLMSIACVAGSPTLAQKKPLQQVHAGAKIAIQAGVSKWKSLGDVVLDGLLINGTSKEISIGWDSPQVAVRFDIENDAGERIGCDLPRTDFWCTSCDVEDIAPGKAFTFKAPLKQWNCPVDVKGKFVIKATWWIDGESVTSTPITLEAGDE